MPNDRPAPEDSGFPTDAEVRRAVEFYVERECNNEWPEDDWFPLSGDWEVNVWEDEGVKKATVYPGEGTFFKERDLGITFIFQKAQEEIHIGPDMDLRIQYSGQGEAPGVFALVSYKGEELGHVCIEWYGEKLGFYMGEPNSITDEPTYIRKYTLAELDAVVKEINS